MRMNLIFRIIHSGGMMAALFSLTVAVFFLLHISSTNTPLGLQDTQVQSSKVTHDKTELKIVESVGKLPLTFERNVGQIDSSIRYFVRGAGYSTYFLPGEVVVVLNRTDVEMNDIRSLKCGKDERGRAPQPPKSVRVISLKLIGANTEATISGTDELPGKTNYFIGNDPRRWYSDVPTFARVKYEKIYPGIDAIYYGNKNQIEFDFVVAPGRNPNVITLKVDGVQNLEVDAGGNLLINIGPDHLMLKKPAVYQDTGHGRTKIPGSYKLDVSTGMVGFILGSYNTDRTLVIDPVLVYSTKLGGAYDCAGRAIAVDSAGCVYVTGRTSTNAFPVTQGAFQPIRGINNTNTNQDYEAFVTKFNAEGTALEYSTYIGGSDYDEEALGIAVDASGCAYITGITWSNNFPTTPGAFQRSSKDPGRSDWYYGDAFVTKLNPTGSSLIYSTYLGGGQKDGRADYGTAIAVDAVGNAYVTGFTECEDFPSTSGAFMENHAYPNRGDAFVTKLNSDGSALLYSTFLGGVSEDWASGIAIDAEGNAYVVGETGGGFPTTPGAIQTTGHCFVAKVNPTGTGLVYSTCLGDRYGVLPRGTALDKTGCVYLTGIAKTSMFPTTSGALQPGHKDGSNAQLFGDAFVTKLNPTGTGLLYSTFFGGTSMDAGTGIAVDNDGRAYVFGITRSSDFSTKDAAQGVYGGGYSDAFVALLDPAQIGEASLLYSTYLGGSGQEIDGGVNPAAASTMYYDVVVTGYWFGGIAIDTKGNAYVTGQTGSANFPTTGGAFSGAGSGVAFVAKIGVAGSIPEVGVWQELVLRSPGAFGSQKDSNVVTFDSYPAEVLWAGDDSIGVLVPPDLVLNRTVTETLPDTLPRVVTVVARVVKGPGDTAKVLETKVRFLPPQLLIHDQVTRSSPPVRQGWLDTTGFSGAVAYVFLGRSTDGMAAVRLTNTSTKFPPPIALLAKVFAPTPGVWFDGSPWPSYGNLTNIGVQNAGIQFPIDRDGWYIVVVMGGPLPNPPVYPEVPNSPGPFPAQFQIHLAGNVGLPRKVGEPPRGIRLDSYFNHPAPRTETLVNHRLVPGEWAETGLFKFANVVSVSQYAIAALIPPMSTPPGFIFGTPPVRAVPPTAIFDITTPHARTPGAANPALGTVIDVAQVPVPASVQLPGSPPGVAAILGAPDGNGVTLPYQGTTTVVTSVIVDMGSGNEIVNGTGADFKVYGLSGTYSVAVSNTPFANTFVAVGSGSGEQSFDIAPSGLSSTRYILISGMANIDAVKSLHFFADNIHPTAGPMSDVGYTTITMRRQKSPLTAIDPLIELIGPDGSFLGKNESGFGDDTDQDRSDAALIKVSLTQQGFYRWLGRGYDIQPDAQGFGTYFTRVETAGEYDPVELTVSSTAEAQTTAQKQGNITLPRQRDSYLFQAVPGSTVNIVVNSIGSPALGDPLVELYDPEDFLVAANDNYSIARGRNAVVSVTLSTTGRTFPNPSTYRIVVMGLDTTTGSPSPVTEGVAHLRTANGGRYELKVFSGPLTGETPQAPSIASVTPDAAVQGATNVDMSIGGSNFANGATVSVSGTGVTTTSVMFVSGSQLKLKVDIEATAATGRRDVTVTNPGGQGGTAVGAFEVRQSLGQVLLNWSAPTVGQTLDPPGNLSAQFNPSGGGAQFSGALGLRYKTGGKGDATVRTSIKSVHPIGGTRPESVVAEVEPNNTVAEAQVLTGDTLIVVNGRAEVRDVGEIEDLDDIEDLYKFTTTQEGLEITLDGFTSDCDLYLIQLADTSVLDYSAASSEVGPEWIQRQELPAGTYLIGVSIYDPDPLGPDSTAYTLEVRGHFGGTTTLTLLSYNIFRSTQANARGTGVKVASVGVGTTTFSDAVPHTGSFFYQVTAVYNQGESTPSNEVSKVITEVGSGRTPSAIPAGFALYQNYPNPFNPTTGIRYQVPVASMVRLVVYDMLGRELAVLVDEMKQPGTYEVHFSAAGLTSGVYFCRLTAKDFQQTKKLLMLQ